MTFSTSLLWVSAMYTLPAESTATPSGVLSSELVAGPRVGAPAVPLPAITDRIPAAVTFSTSLLFVSAMYTLPAESTATSDRRFSLELVASPAVGAPAVPLPAITDRIPAVVTFSTSLLLMSAM